MTIELRPITRENVVPVIELAFKPEQKGFVATNAKSLSQAYVHRHWIPLAIYSGETPVGFVMYAHDEDGSWWLIRYMIDGAHQGKGHGKTALPIILDRMRAEGAETIYLSCDPANAVALALYARHGFVETGEILEDEIVLRADYGSLVQ
ncbi:MAG: GNAT family N-acetyltransferase [Thermomicrobiales bacterium]